MYKRFDYSEITPKGWIARQLKIQAEGLAGNLDNMWPDVQNSAWIGGDKEGWERVPYWLDGFVPLAYLLRDKGMIARAQKYLHAIMDRQQPDGWICPCKEEERANYDMWALFLICKVLAEYGDYAHDDRAVECAYKAMKNFYSRLKEGTSVIRWWAKFRHYEAMISLNVLKERYGEEWIDELALMIKSQGADYADYTEEWKVPLFCWHQQTHIVNLGMMLKSEAVYLPFTKAEYKDEAQRLYDILYKYNGTAVGIINGDETLAGVSPVAGTELCAVVEMMYSCEKLFEMTGDVKWLDLLERVAFNALPATTSEDMWTHQYVQQANQIGCAHLPGKSPWMTNGSEANMFGLEPNYGCCTANMGQGWPKLAHSVFLKSEKGVLAALPMSSRLDTVINGVKVRIEAKGDYPFSDRTVYTVKAEKPVKFEFAIRIPADGRAKINGKPRKSRIIKINKTWRGERKITLELKFDVRLSPRPKQMYFAERGSLVFALPIDAEWRMCEFERGGVVRKFPYCDYELYPKSDWAYGFCSGKLKFGFEKAGKIPFSEKEPPARITAKLAPVEWGFLRGYTTVADRWPKHRKALGAAKEFTLIPYGCTKLRMTELPKIKK